MNKEMRNIQVIKDLDGKSIVIINDVIFKGKKKVDWDDVEQYLKKYVGEFYEIADTKDIVYIGSDLPDKYAHSKYTKSIMGVNAKAKANLTNALPEIIETATNKRYKENLNPKHSLNAKHGWYRYDSKFTIPIYDDYGDICHYNIYAATLVVRIANRKKLYLYDIIQIKKETNRPFCPNWVTK